MCAYCERSEAGLGGEEFFEIDHFRPLKRFPGQRTHYANLYNSCGPCNRHKGNAWPSDDLMELGYRFADPCEEDLYVMHVNEAPNGTLGARTRVGDYTCGHIRLNRQALVEWRREKRRIASELAALEAIALEIGIKLDMTPGPAERLDIEQRLAALQATISKHRKRYGI